MLARQEAEIDAGLTHLEIYTLRGLLTILWHGPRDASSALIACGGAMGGLLGPGAGLYHQLGRVLADAGIATLRVGYRRPNDLESCTLDLGAAAELAFRAGARRVVTMGHSFGGAVAVRAAVAMPDLVAGVVTLATQSAGCEAADRLACPLLMFHGDADELLPPAASEMVRFIAGQGELVIIPGDGHLLNAGAPDILERLTTWIPEVLKDPDSKERT